MGTGQERHSCRAMHDALGTQMLESPELAYPARSVPKGAALDPGLRPGRLTYRNGLPAQVRLHTG